MTTTQIRVPDFDCPACASTVETALQRTAGVERVEVHFTTGRVEVDHDESLTPVEDLAATIESQGYTPHPT